MKKVGLLCGREYSFPPAFIVRVNELGKKDGVAAEFAKLGGTRMGEPSGYRVIVDRISHEVEYYRGYLKHAVLQGAYVINNPFWWTADDKFFNYAVASKLGIAIPKTVLLPQKGYPSDVDITAESLHNLTYPVDWDGLLDYVGRPAILKPFSGGGWKHVYKVHNKEELLAAYDKTSPYCMTLQEFIDFTQYVRCFTFGKSDISARSLRSQRAQISRRSQLFVLRTRLTHSERRADHQSSPRLRNEYHRIRHPGRHSLCDRFPESRSGFRARPHHRILFRSRRRQNGPHGGRSRAERRGFQSLATLGRDARHGHSKRIHRRAQEHSRGSIVGPATTSSAAPGLKTK